MLSPKRTKFRKVQKGRIKGKAARGNKITKGEFGIFALEPTWITANQIESTRVTLSRYTKKVGKVYIDIFPDKPITKKPAGTRMGSGKGNPEYFVAVVKPGRVLFEITGLSEEVSTCMPKRMGAAGYPAALFNACGSAAPAHRW